MPKEIEVSGVRLEVPDDYTDDQIKAKIQTLRQTHPTIFHGGVAEAAPNAVGASASNGLLSAAGKFISGVGDTLLPSKTPGDYLSGPAAMLMAPFDAKSREQVGSGLAEMGKNAWNAQVGEFGKSLDSAKYAINAIKANGLVSPNTAASIEQGMVQGGGHLLAGLLPLVGPAAAHAGENLAEGNTATGLGQATGLLAPFGVKGIKTAMLGDARTPGGMATQAVKPGVMRAAKFQQAFDKAVPALKETSEAMGTPFDTLDNLAQVVPEAKKALWQKYEAQLQQNGQVAANATDVADAMEAQISPRFQRNNPAAAKAIRTQAAYYRKNPLTLSQLEDELQGANNDLENFYSKAPAARSSAARNPEIGHTVAEANALRQVLYSELEKAGANGARDLKAQYGALSELENPIYRRQGAQMQKPPADLGDRFNLASGVANLVNGVATHGLGPLVKGAAQVAANRALNSINSTDAILGRAYDAANASPVRGLSPMLAPFLLPAGMRPQEEPPQ